MSHRQIHDNISECTKLNIGTLIITNRLNTRIGDNGALQSITLQHMALGMRTVCT